MSYGAPPAELSNNPFIDHPANALSRYPNLEAPDDYSGQAARYTSWLNPGGSSSSPAPLQAQNQYQQTGYAQQQPAYQQPQQTGWAGGGYPQQPQGYGAPQPQPQMNGSGRPFQPSSSFGQQLSAQVTGAYGGMQPQQQQPQQMQAQYTGYPAASPYGAGYQAGYASQQQQQQQQQPVQYLSEFDPYSQGPGQGIPGQASTYAQQHPREYVQQHKAELEAWDAYAWKQVFNAFDTLKDAWGARKRDVEARARAMGGSGLFGGGGYGYGGQGQEMFRLEQLVKEAESHFDSVAASSFQMQEVYSGYRQSGDIASKRRVRESINAALNSLPDWPPQSI